MKKVLAAAVVLALAACAAVDERPAPPVAYDDPGASVAASLGYHGPVDRPPAAALYSRNTTP